MQILLLLATLVAAAAAPRERAAAARITPAELSGRIRFLADDLLAGRKPGTTGAQLATRYLATELEAIGLEAGATGDDGKPSWYQPVPLVELRATVPNEVVFRSGTQQLALAARGGVNADVVLTPDAHVERAAVDDAELVFVGYGIVAPEYGWDDYKDVDVRGKIVVLLNFNPPFAGAGVRLWYGRWDYKYQAAAAHGAIGAYVIHTRESAGYPWQVLSASADGTRIDLPPGDEARLQFRGWATENGARKIVSLGGKDLDALRTAAQRGDFRPVPLGVGTSLAMPIAKRTSLSANVVGKLRGTDAKLRDEAVIYTAHWDHLGEREPAPGTNDGIYNGALDNASGCAAVLAIAGAAKEAPPRRSLLFVFVTAEEQGLLGSRWFSLHPTLPPGRIAADINVDEVNKWGSTTDVGMLGFGKSSLDAVVKQAASEQGRTVHGDPFPDRGAFYRSDQFEMARIGVPVVAVSGGPTYVGRPPEWGAAMQEQFERRDYHQVTDEYHGDWDLSGAVQDAQLQLIVGLRIANATALPQWTPGDEFEKARKTAGR